MPLFIYHLLLILLSAGSLPLFADGCGDIMNKLVQSPSGRSHDSQTGSRKGHESKISGEVGAAPVKELSTHLFSDRAYRTVQEKMSSQIDTWIKEAEKAGDTKRAEVLKSHRDHVNQMLEYVDAHSAKLIADGYNPERLKAAILTHDIGKFVPAEPKVAERHTLRMFREAPTEKVLDYLQKTKGMSEEKAQRFLSRVRATPGNRPQDILSKLSDGDRAIIIEASSLPATKNFFAEFMDHAETSREWMRRNPFFGESGDPDNLTRQMMLDSYGHDGPSPRGAWWGENYGPATGGRTYPEPQSAYGELLRGYDRANQSHLQFLGEQLAGGPRKIAIQRLGSSNTPEAHTSAIREGLTSVPQGTQIQLDYLISQGKVPRYILDLIQKSIQDVNRLGENTLFYQDGTARPKGAPADAIGHVKIGNAVIYFRNIDEFFGTPNSRGAAGSFWKTIIEQ